MAKLLIFGYGNPSRGDDALGPLLLEQLQEQNRQDNGDLELLIEFQLQVEHVFDLARAELVLFVDASVSCRRPYEFAELSAMKDSSYTSHAMSPASLLHVYGSLYHEAPPPCFLLSIRGESFKLGEDLSPPARAHLAAAGALVEKLRRQPFPDFWRKIDY